MGVSALLLKKAKGDGLKLLNLWLASSEADVGALPKVLSRILQRCSQCRQESHNVLNYTALPDGLWEISA